MKLELEGIQLTFRLILVLNAALSTTKGLQL